MKYVFFIGILLHSAIFSSAQQTIILSKADSLRAEGQLDQAIEAYKNEYSINPGNEINLYNYCCALSLSRQIDSAFRYLVISTANNPSANPLTDPDLLNLRKDPRWSAFENKLIFLLQKQNGNAFKDIEYAKILWQMKASDQAYYSEIELAEKKLGMQSTLVYALWDLKSKLNHENQELLESLILTKGWPKISAVGRSAAGAAFLVIQHADLEKQKKYLPMIKKLCEEQEAVWSSYALMYDRIQTSENKPQRYGSQVTYNSKTKKYELFPLEDKSKVDQWRAEAGMGPLSEYVAHWDIVFDPKK